MKYIDSEKLIAEIERRKNNNLISAKKCPTGYFSLVANEDIEILGIVNSLQQEQPEVDLEIEQDFDDVDPKHLVHQHIHIDECPHPCVKSNCMGCPIYEKKEQLGEADLEKFISDFFDKKDAENNGRWSEDDIVEAITKAYELGLNARKK